MILRANVPGVVIDGRVEKDIDLTTDDKSVSMSFGGFSSDACNIESYDWALGSEPYFSDIIPFTDINIVMEDNMHGFGEMHIDLSKDAHYFTTVRAKTGYNCHEEYIVSTSDGFTIDNTPPVIYNIIPSTNRTVLYGESYYQPFDDSLDVEWNVSDVSHITSVKWAVGTYPGLDDIHTTTNTSAIQPGEVHLAPGNSVFVTVTAVDAAGNSQTAHSLPISSDISPPLILNLTCNQYISVLSGTISCSWLTLEELESLLGGLQIGVDFKDGHGIQFHEIHKGQRSWKSDVHHRIKSNAYDLVEVIFKVSNILGESDAIYKTVYIDNSPPIAGEVHIVTRINVDDDLVVKTCQIPNTYIELNVSGFNDPETFISK